MAAQIVAYEPELLLELDLPAGYDSFVFTERDGRHAFYSPEVNRLLAEQLLGIEMLPNWFRQPAIAHKLKGVAIKARDGRTLYNGNKLRLASDLTERTFQEGEILKLQPTSYWASLATNEMTACRVVEDGQEIFSGFELVANAHRLLPLLSDCRLSNHIGTATLAFSRDNVLLVPRQSKKMEQNRLQLTSSGAGSCDVDDYTHSQPGSLQELLAATMERELREECALGAEVDIITGVIGYARDLERGGKPDFFGVSLIDADIAELPKHPGRGEIVDLEQHPLAGVDADSVLAVIQALRERRNVSLTLHLAMLFLEQQLERDPRFLELARVGLS